MRPIREAFESPIDDDDNKIVNEYIFKIWKYKR